MTYIHEWGEWPQFTFDLQALAAPLARVRNKQGLFIGQMRALGFHLRSEVSLTALTQEVLKSSEIEGEILDSDQVRSSIARHLGLEIAGLKPSDRSVEGVVEMMLDATQNYQRPLTEERLFTWHKALFPNHGKKIGIGRWRDDNAGPMQVISGSLGYEKVHYQAPAASRLKEEMRAFLSWFDSEANMDQVLKAGLAHLWFVTIHPFDDGNGRIARAIADLLLTRSEGSAQRFYSLSAQIRAERKGYYEILERTQRSDLDVTSWLEWFLACLERAIENAEKTLGTTFRKARFWDKHRTEAISERQRLVLNQALDGISGRLTSSLWAKLAKCSQDTAGRDINDLVEKGVLAKTQSGGRSTAYSLME